MNLNEKQKEAVEFVNGNLLIVASAGTGKTTTIVNRYINMVENHGFNPEEIMMTTFTNKSARDINEKIKKYTKKMPKYIGTMHSIFLKILRFNADYLNFSRDFIVLSDDNDKRKILREILKCNNISDKYENIFYFISWISKFKNRGITADTLENNIILDKTNDNYEVEEIFEDELINVSAELRKKVNFIYNRYQSYLKINNIIDFDDVLLYTLKLFEENSNILDYYKKKFKSIMVDEAQDLNVVQIRILEKLENDNLCLIGDDCQNIYEWRGASNELVFDFSKNKKTIYLEENYRSKEKIIKAINDTIKEMRFKIDKQLKCSRDIGEDIHVYFFDSLIHESKHVSKKIKELLDKGYREEDIAIIFRTNYIGKFFEKELIRNKISCYLSKSKSFFEKEEVKDFISFLRLKINYNSEIDFERILKLIDGIKEININNIIEYARNEGLNLIDAINYYERFELDNIVGKNLLKLKELILDSDSSPSTQFFDNFNYTKLIEKKYYYDIKKLKEKRENIQLIKEIYDSYSDEMGIVRFLDDLIESDKNDDIKGKVVLSTIHSAKGLEWKHVFLVCCNEGILPYYKDRLGTIKRDSELRLFYVAISRAKDNLYVSGSRTHNWSEYDPSHFLDMVYIR